MSNAVPFDEKEIRGINARHVIWLAGGLITILASVLTTYFSIVTKINRTQDDMQTLKVSKDVTDVQIKTINLQLQELQIRVVRLETQMQQEIEYRTSRNAR